MSINYMTSQEKYETKLTASVVKYDPNAQKVKDNDDFDSSKHWTGKQHSSTKADTCPSSAPHVSPSDCCVSVVL